MWWHFLHQYISVLTLFPPATIDRCSSTWRRLSLTACSAVSYHRFKSWLAVSWRCLSTAALLWPFALTRFLCVSATTCSSYAAIKSRSIYWRLSSQDYKTYSTTSPLLPLSFSSQSSTRYSSTSSTLFNSPSPETPISLSIVIFWVFMSCVSYSLSRASFPKN